MSNQTRIWTAARSEPSIPAAGPNIPWHTTVQDSQHSTGVLAQHGTGQHRTSRTAQESQNSTGEPGEHRTEELAQDRRAGSAQKGHLRGSAPTGRQRVWSCLVCTAEPQNHSGNSQPGNPPCIPCFRQMDGLPMLSTPSILGGVCESPFLISASNGRAWCPVPGAGL